MPARRWRVACRCRWRWPPRRPGATRRSRHCWHAARELVIVPAGAVSAAEQPGVAGGDRLRAATCRPAPASQPGAGQRGARPACRTPATSAACCAAPARFGVRQVLALQGHRRRSGRPRCCAPAWARISGCICSRGWRPRRSTRCGVPLVATSSHAAATAARRPTLPAALRLGAGPRRAGCVAGADGPLCADGAHPAARRRGVAERRRGGRDLPVRERPAQWPSVDQALGLQVAQDRGRDLLDRLVRRATARRCRRGAS